jgi:hypothetical protein
VLAGFELPNRFRADATLSIKWSCDSTRGAHVGARPT